MVDDVGDPKQVNSKKKRYQLELEQRIEDFRNVALTTEGRAVLWRLLELCGVFKDAFGGDAAHTFRNTGKQAIGKEIFIMFDELGIEGEQAQFKMISESKYRQRKVEGSDA